MLRKPFYKLGQFILAAAISACSGLVSAAAPSSADELFMVWADTPSPSPASGSIDRIRSFYNSASWEMPIPEGTWKLLSSVGAQGLRLINVESRGGIRAVDSVDYDFKRLDEGLADAARYHLQPHIIVGAVPQNILTKDNNSSATLGMEVNHSYQNYANALVAHVLENNAFKSVIFEVGNEADTGSQAWLSARDEKKGARDVYDAYFRVYSVWARAVGEIAAKHPEKSVEIGGPAITPYSLAYGATKWAPQFIEDVKKSGVRMDFFSFHYYGNDGALPGKAAFGPYPTLAGQVNYFRNLLDRNQMKSVGLYMTEWGPSSQLGARPLGVINGSNVGAAWTAEFLIALADLPVKKAVALLFRDHTIGSSGQDNPGWPAFLAADGVTPKPMYNVFSMFSKLPEKRVRAVIAQSVGTAIAAADRDSIGIILAQDDDQSKFARNTLKTVSIKSIPFSTSSLTVTEYLIDAKTSNLFFRNSGREIGNVGLTKVGESKVAVNNHGTTLSLDSVDGASVRLWIMRPNPS